VKKILPANLIVLYLLLSAGTEIFPVSSLWRVKAACANPSVEQAEKIMKSLSKAYPEKISCVEYRNGDWAVLMEGKWYFCADNRLLPEELLHRKESYSPQSFYEYFPNLPEWIAYEGEAAERQFGIRNSELKNKRQRQR